MYSNNPYAQAGWTNPQNVPAANTSSWRMPPSGQASVYGALPSHFDIPKEIAIGTGPMRFQLHAPPSGYPSILNSTLYTPRNTPYMEVVTDRNMTYFRNLSDQTCIASINWGVQPVMISISGTPFDNCSAGQWFVSSPDGSRTLHSRDYKQYKWVPEGHHISLYAVGRIPQGSLASIQRDQRSVTLNLSSEAVKAGMMELIVSIVLLQSGRNF